jgi:hypothetical protein
VPFSHHGALSGSPGSLSFSDGSVFGGVTLATSFTGTLSGSVINGTLTHTETHAGVNGNTTVTGGGTTSFAVTLTLQ